jgi:hypothetical protein
MRDAGATTPILILRLLIPAPRLSLHFIGNACRFHRCPDLEITFFAASAVVA